MKDKGIQIKITVPEETENKMINRWAELGFRSPQNCSDFVLGILTNASMDAMASEIRKFLNLDVRFFGICDEDFHSDDDPEEME